MDAKFLLPIVLKLNVESELLRYKRVCVSLNEYVFLEIGFNFTKQTLLSVGICVCILYPSGL